MLDIENLTIADARRIASMFCQMTAASPVAAVRAGGPPVPVVVCTDKRGVFFGYCDDLAARPLTLASARMCIYWSSDVGGVLGLGDIGPTKECRISASVESLTLEGVTSVYSASSTAEAAWKKAAVYGR